MSFSGARPAPKFWRRPRAWLFCGLGLGMLFFAWFGLASRIDPLALAPSPGALVLARGGEVLRLVSDARGRRQALLPAGETPALLREAFLAAEDSRFFEHCGVDPRAVARAALANWRAKRVVSGASTITQQLARLSHPEARNLLGKLIEMARALRLELAYNKDEILRLYLDQVPLGNNLVGVEAASLAYFEKPARELNPAEAASLASMARSPGRFGPFGPGRARLLARKNWVLERMALAGALSLSELELAKDAALDFRQPGFAFKAPHLVELALREAAGNLPADARLQTTCDAQLQERLEEVLASHRARLEKLGITQAAAVVLSNQGPRILALAGSLGYAAENSGFNNGALAMRSPGSALKPFLYALALDRGIPTSSVLDDVRRGYATPGGEFNPANFDRVAQGPVSLREALGNSLNLSAVRLLSLVGPELFFQTLQGLDLINHPERGAEHYGLGLVVGNPEVSPLQLAQAYSSLANGGNFAPATLLSGAAKPVSRVFSPEAAFIVSDILSDPLARQRSFGGSPAMNPPFSLALKTGTSTYYRDVWCVGYTRDFTITVWCGNFDGRPSAGQSGSSAAAPILVELARIMLENSSSRGFSRPSGVLPLEVCAFSGMLPTPACPHRRVEFFVQGATPGEECVYHSQGEPWHRVPGNFASWLGERNLRGQQGRFRLNGFDEEPGYPAPRAPSGANASARGSALSGPEIPGPALLAPLPGSIYLADPKSQGQAKVLAQAECLEPLPFVVWYLDGVESARSGPPYEHWFELGRGRHNIMAAGPDGFGQKVTVSVE